MMVTLGPLRVDVLQKYACARQIVACLASETFWIGLEANF
jgi:hypothetical protein